MLVVGSADAETQLRQEQRDRGTDAHHQGQSTEIQPQAAVVLGHGGEPVRLPCGTEDTDRLVEYQAQDDADRFATSATGPPRNSGMDAGLENDEHGENSDGQHHRADSAQLAFEELGPEFQGHWKRL